MSTTFFAETADPPEIVNVPYRTTSKMAMLSLIFGLLSVLGLLAPSLILFSVVGAFASVVALRTIGRHPDEYSGRSLAMAGGVLSLSLMAAASLFHTYVYYTEVPEGYERISFKTLQSNSGAPGLVPEEAIALDGKKVFVGGYMHPDAGQAPVQSFVLVPDMGTCCFGGQPELTDMIEVTLTGKDRMRYRQRKRKMAGTLRVNTMLKPREELQGTYYQLVVDKIVR